jgi:hypothetical protein
MREVSHLYLTALLRMRGHTPSRVSGDGRRAVWVFDASPELAADVAAYYSGELQVSARDCAEGVHSAKGQAMNIAVTNGAAMR